MWFVNACSLREHERWMDRWVEGSMRTVRMCGLSLSWYHSLPSGNKRKTWLVYRKLLFCFNFPLISTGEMCFCVYFSLFQWNPCQGFSKWSSVLYSGEVVKGFCLWSHICCLCWLPIKSHSSCIFSFASLSTTRTPHINEMLKFLHLYEPNLFQHPVLGKIVQHSYLHQVIFEFDTNLWCCMFCFQLPTCSFSQTSCCPPPTHACCTFLK